MRYRWAAAPVTAVILAGACDSSAVAPIDSLPRQLTASEKHLVDSGNDFSVQLFLTAEQAELGSNIIISPLSASYSLGMAMNGAAGETLAEMRDVLGWSGYSMESSNEAYANLSDLLTGIDGSVDVALANSFWYRDGLDVRPEFSRSLGETFGARLGSLDFTARSAVDEINDWVSSSTRGRIKTIVDQIPNDAVGYLINAVYFLAPWTVPFDRNQTTEKLFVVSPEHQTTVKMMHRTGEVRYGTTSEITGFELDYGGGAYAMTILLPSSGSDLAPVRALLRNGELLPFIASMSSGRAQIGLPRFELSYKTELKGALSASGMVTPFLPTEADFSGMASGGEDFYISRVMHKTFIKVDEAGTEAAAVTGTEIGVVSAPPALVADRPFVFLIRERLSGTIMFIGRVSNPNDSM